jgi:hypothetical protein
VIFPLFAVGDDRRTRGLEALDGVSDGFVIERVQRRVRAVSCRQRLDQSKGPGNTADWLGRYIHRWTSVFVVFAPGVGAHPRSCSTRYFRIGEPEGDAAWAGDEDRRDGCTRSDCTQSWEGRHRRNPAQLIESCGRDGRRGTKCTAPLGRKLGREPVSGPVVSPFPRPSGRCKTRRGHTHV